LLYNITLYNFIIKKFKKKSFQKFVIFLRIFINIGLCFYTVKIQIWY
jgi:hypothetical protein